MQYYRKDVHEWMSEWVAIFPSVKSPSTNLLVKGRGSFRQFWCPACRPPERLLFGALRLSDVGFSCAIAGSLFCRPSDARTTLFPVRKIRSRHARTTSSGQPTACRSRSAACDCRREHGGFGRVRLERHPTRTLPAASPRLVGRLWFVGNRVWRHFSTAAFRRDTDRLFALSCDFRRQFQSWAVFRGSCRCSDDSRRVHLSVTEKWRIPQRAPHGSEYYFPIAVWKQTTSTT